MIVFLVIVIFIFMGICVLLLFSIGGVVIVEMFFLNVGFGYFI